MGFGTLGRVKEAALLGRVIALTSVPQRAAMDRAGNSRILPNQYRTKELTHARQPAKRSGEGTVPELAISPVYARLIPVGGANYLPAGHGEKEVCREPREDLR